MRSVKMLRSVILILLSTILIFLLIGCTVLPDEGTSQLDGTEEPGLPQPKALTDETEIELLSAIQTAASGREDVMAFIIYRVTIDHVEYSEDKSLALVWIALVDKETGLIQSGEPGLVIAHATGDETTPWKIVFQADANFAEELNKIPDSLLSADVKEHYMPAIQQESKDGTVFTGYRLPWTSGSTVYLTGSIGHVFTYKSCPTTCLYAFDFANGTMFPVRAAKGGTVKYVAWAYENGNTTNANYLVLEDTSTTPTTYQVYYHFAKNTIPEELRVVGAKVVQGQYLGNADDTGYSSGNHLHFHVHTNATSYWGNSVDIVFDEVSVNGGRPRTCAEAAAYPAYGSECMSGNKYVSANSDSESPIGGISSPEAYSSVTSGTLNVSGWMKDDVGIDHGQLLYNDGGDWIEIGNSITTSPFTEQIDLCSADIEKGTFFLSLDVLDKAGKNAATTQGLTELTMDYECPPDPPACTPADNQVALYTEAEYQGTCQVFDIGEYANLGSLSTSFLDNTRSVEIGSAVSAILYADVDYGGTYELFQNGDAYLSNNSIGDANAASMKVENRIEVPEPPVLTLPSVIDTSHDINLSWNVVEGEETSSSLTSAEGYSNSLDWQTSGAWNVGILPEGTYTWTVTAMNLAGSASTSQEFSVEATADLPVTHLIELPEATYSTAVKVGWEVDSGADGIDHFELQYRTRDGEWTDWTDTTLYSDVKEVLFFGTPGQIYEFRLRAVDLLGNAEAYLDGAEVSTTLVEGCEGDIYEGTDPGDDGISTALVMETGTATIHNWCTAGDADWVSFAAVAGDQLRLNTSTDNLASAALLTLYGTDGSTFIGEARPSTSSGDAYLDWTVPADGVYYLELSPIDTRIVGTDTEYTVDITQKSSIDTGTLVCGSISIPALLAAIYTAFQKVQKTKKKKGVGW